jgi:hypothetical protein
MELIMLLVIAAFALVGIVPGFYFAFPFLVINLGLPFIVGFAPCFVLVGIFCWCVHRYELNAYR